MKVIRTKVKGRKKPTAHVHAGHAPTAHAHSECQTQGCLARATHRTYLSLRTRRFKNKSSYHPVVILARLDARLYMCRRLQFNRLIFAKGTNWTCFIIYQSCMCQTWAEIIKSVILRSCFSFHSAGSGLDILVPGWRKQSMCFSRHVHVRCICQK